MHLPNQVVVVAGIEIAQRAHLRALRVVMLLDTAVLVRRGALRLALHLYRTCVCGGVVVWWW